MRRDLSGVQYIAKILIIMNDVEGSTEFKKFKERYGTPGKETLYQSCMDVFDGIYDGDLRIDLNEDHPYAKSVIRRIKEVMLHGD